MYTYTQPAKPEHQLFLWQICTTGLWHQYWKCSGYIYVYKGNRPRFHTTSSWKTWAGRKIQTGCTSVFPIFVLLYQTSQEFLFSKIAWHVCGLAETLELEFIIFSGLRKAGDAPGHKIVVALFVQPANLVGPSQNEPRLCVANAANSNAKPRLSSAAPPKRSQARTSQSAHLRPRPAACPAKRAQTRVHAFLSKIQPHRETVWGKMFFILKMVDVVKTS